MKRFAYMLLLAVQIAFSAFAQDNPNALIKEKIRDIKLGEEFVFAESTSTTSPEDARNTAMEELHSRVITLLTSLGKNGEAAEDIWNTIKDTCQTLEYQNISLHKAFTYMLKSSATGDIAYTVSNPQANTQPVSSSVTGTAIGTTPPVIQTTPEPPLINLDDFDISEEELEKPLSQDVNALLALDTYESVMLYLDAMQDDGRLVYGRIATLTSPEQAYLIIIKDGKLIAVLDKGKGQRLNLRTKEMEVVKKYQGHAIIWMKTFK